ncbi:hypothetical protein [uncultured Amphritea sp.]|uniref:hypothetical protein n=1 Tax=uncultured Amphritea sp. TaxID=981605 RepID=UPI00263652D2|nr:hypothetical protein [uncultured Amphritea sp.]
MLAGHIGAALAISHLDRRVNLGVLVAASLLLDLLLWSFILFGWESVMVPDNYAEQHQLKFNFAYSHSLSAAVIWSAMAGAASFLWYAEHKGLGFRAVFMVSVAVLSHWLLDFTVHNPNIPLLGEASFKVGLGLWDNMPLALLFEGGILVSGLFLFLFAANISALKMSAITIICLLVLATTVVSMTIAPAPPSTVTLAESSLVIILVTCLLTGWLAK